jgi:hypothetical protein
VADDIVARLERLSDELLASDLVSVAAFTIKAIDEIERLNLELQRVRTERDDISKQLDHVRNLQP